MKKMKQFLAVLLVLALVAVPMISQSGMYEVHAEEENVETMGKDVSDTETIPSEEISDTEDGAPESDKPQKEAEKLPETEGGDETSPAQPKQALLRAPEKQADVPNKIVNSDFVVEKIEITKDASNIKAPYTFDVELTISGDLRDTINSLQILYACKDHAKSFEINRNDTEITYMSGPEVTKYTISDVKLNEYFSTGKYELRQIFIQMNEWTSEVYYTWDDSGNFSCKENGDVLDYQGEADFTVTSSEKVDNVEPEILSAKRITEDPIYSHTSIEYEVEIKEETSGVERIDLSFTRKKDDNTENVTVYILQGGNIEAGTTSVIISAVGGFEPDEYQLYSMQITDRAGNWSYYEKSEEDETKFIFHKDAGANNPTVTVTDNKFRIEKPKPTSPVVTGLRWADGVDSQNVTAGDKLEAILTIKNPTNKQLQIEPENCGIYWQLESTGNTEHATCKTSQGGMVVLEPEETYNMSFELQVNKYTSSDIRRISSINLSERSGTGDIYYHSVDNQLVGLNMDGLTVDTLPYNGELDFKVTGDSQPDTEAPMIESIIVAEESLKAPGTITFKIKTKGEEVSPITYLQMYAVGESGYELYFIYDSKQEEGSAKLSYSEEEGCYIYEQELSPLALAETYTINSVFIKDEAENFRGYYDRGGEILDDDGNPLPESKFTVVESAAPDTDTTYPILKKVTARTTEVAPKEEFQVDIRAEEESGLDSVILGYVLADRNAWMNIEADRIERNGDVYTCTFKMKPYVEAGEYRLQNIEISDKSCRGNRGFYDYDDEVGAFVDYSTSESTGVGTVGLTVLPTEEYLISGIDEVTDKVTEVKEKGTIVVTGVDAYNTPALPQEFIQQAKNKKLDIIIPSMNGNAEIKVKAEDLSDTTDYSLAIDTQDWMEEEGIIIGDEEHDLVTPLRVVTSDKSIPVTIRVKLDRGFIESCGGKGITLSRKETSGEYKVVAENLIPDEDGYVKVSLSQGWAEAVKAKLLGLFGMGNELETMEFCFSAKSDAGGEPVPVTGITLNKNEMTLARGASETLKATVLPADADAEVTWTTSDQSVATVASDGTVVAVDKGDAIITAEAGGKSVICKVSVNVPLESISIEQEDGITTLKKGDSIPLTVVYSPEDTTDAKDVVWSSSDTSKVTVDENGKVTAVADGPATVTIKATVGKLEATYKVTVQEVKLTGIKLDKETATIHRGDSTQLKVTYEPENTTEDRTVTWSSSDTSKVTVDGNGKVTGVAVGGADITATVGNFTATCKVTVDAPLKQILPDPATISLVKGQSTVLKHTLVPEDTTDSKEVSYMSSDQMVASVDADGTVKAIAKGTATITLIGANNVKAEVPVTVTEVPINEVILDKVNTVVEKGATVELTADVNSDTTDDNKTITWSVEDKKVATVNKTTTTAGEKVTVTAVAGGTTTIIAKAWNGTYATCEITVPIHLEGIELATPGEPILRGKTATLEVKYNPENMMDDVTLAWESSDPEVATVDSATGKITAKAEGETEITVTASTKEKATFTDTAKIEVKEKHLVAEEVKELEGVLQSNLDKILKGQMIEVDKVLSRDYIYNQYGVTDALSIYWSIDDEEVLKIDKSAFCGMKAGKATVTVTITAVDGRGKRVEFDPISTEVIVKEISLNSIAFDKVIKEMKVGEVQTLGILYNPTDTTEAKDVVWTSSDDTVLSVKEGKLTALKAGVAEITAKVGEKSVSCKITVKENTAGTGKGDAATKDKNVDQGKDGKVKTGDTTNIALYFLTMLFAFGTVLAIVRKRIRR